MSKVCVCQERMQRGDVNRGCQEGVLKGYVQAYQAGLFVCITNNNTRQTPQASSNYSFRLSLNLDGIVVFGAGPFQLFQRDKSKGRGYIGMTKRRGVTSPQETRARLAGTYDV